MNDRPEPPENQRTGGHEPAILLPGVILALLGALVAIHLARSFVLNEQGDIDFTVWFAFIPLRWLNPEAFPGGLWPLLWTPLTHAFLHAGWEHLLINSAWLAIFGTPVARRYGAVATLLVFAISAIAGALAFAVTTLPDLQLLIGASGGVAGLTGAACRFIFQPVLVVRDPLTGEPRAVGRRTASLKELALHGRARFFIGFWLLLNAAVPFLPMIVGGESGIAWQAHLGGFIAGLLIVPLFERRPGASHGTA